MHGYSFESTSSSGGTGEVIPDQELAPPWLTPRILVDTIKRMENYATTDRDTYTSVMHAISASMHGIRAHKGALSWTEELNIGLAVTEWACKWPGDRRPRGQALEDEHTKWTNDFAKYPVGGFHTGWNRLVDLAASLGHPDIKADVAAREFTAEVRPLDYKANDEPAYDPDSPLGRAASFVRQHHTADLARTLHRHAGEFYRWNGKSYRVAGTEDIRSALWKSLADGKPTKRVIDEAFDALKAVANVPSEQAPPVWLDGRDGPPPHELVSCTNGLLHLPTRQLQPHTPLLFGLHALGYAYQPDALEPVEWLRFLNELWPDDQELIDALREWFGLLLTTDTSFQKMLLLIGPKRSGKGTIATILQYLVGLYNVCGPTLGSLGGTFGMEPMIGKLLAVISDARLGERTDKSVVAERLLTISGEGSPTVDRKNRTSWTGKLPTRFIVLTNELPRLADASGALASRFIILRLTRSFYGREDRQLASRLVTELPAILNWSLAGWDRLHERDSLTQPASSLELVQRLEDLASPIGAFIRDRCTTDPEQPGTDVQVSKDTLFAAWRDYCHDQGRTFAGTKATFGRDLVAYMPEIGESRPGSGERERVYTGIRLKAEYAINASPTNKELFQD